MSCGIRVNAIEAKQALVARIVGSRWTVKRLMDRCVRNVPRACRCGNIRVDLVEVPVHHLEIVAGISGPRIGGLIDVNKRIVDIHGSHECGPGPPQGEDFINNAVPIGLKCLNGVAQALLVVGTAAYLRLIEGSRVPDEIVAPDIPRHDIGKENSSSKQRVSAESIQQVTARPCRNAKGEEQDGQ